jgi:chemotaxis protein MotA
MADVGLKTDIPRERLIRPSKPLVPTPVLAKKRPGPKPDLATICGLILAFSGIVGGLLMEGGRIQDVAQVTAALIVLGGTLGAVLVTNPLPTVLRAARQIGCLFFDRAPEPDSTIDELIEFAVLARKNGIVSLEHRTPAIEDSFLRKALDLAVDGVDMDQIRSIMELEITVLEQNCDAEARVFESAGGYSPTIGIIGAVLGLIQVMKNLANIDEVGKGIAIAFVATVYGVGAANLIFLPAAGKLRSRMREIVRLRELMLEGVLSIAEGLNQKLIRCKLEAYSQPKSSGAKPKVTREAAGKPVPAAG